MQLRRKKGKRSTRLGPVIRLRRRPEASVETPEIRPDSGLRHKYGPFTAGSLIEDYRIDGCLGWAGMASAYLAHHVRTGEAVTIKALHEFLLDERNRNRFNAEITFLRRFRHPNLQRLVTSGEIGGRPYLVTEYVPGVQLHVFLERRRPSLSMEARTGICLQIVAALIELARLGIVHRDVKRENVLVRADRRGRPHAVLIDCGLAHKAWSHAPVDMSGTPEVVGPQQASGCVPDFRDDLFSLGVMLYETLVEAHPAKDMGVNLFADPTYLAALREHQIGFKPLRERDASVPQPLADAIMRLLSFRREDRFQDGHALAKALAPFVSATARKAFRTTVGKDRNRSQIRRGRAPARAKTA